MTDHAPSADHSAPTQDNDALLSECEAYCEAAEIAESTLGIRALNNARAIERMRRRTQRDAENAARLRAYMKANPAKGYNGEGSGK